MACCLVIAQDLFEKDEIAPGRTGGHTRCSRSGKGIEDAVPERGECFDERRNRDDSLVCCRCSATTARHVEVLPVGQPPLAPAWAAAARAPCAAAWKAGQETGRLDEPCHPPRCFRRWVGWRRFADINANSSESYSLSSGLSDLRPAFSAFLSKGQRSTPNAPVMRSSVSSVGFRNSRSTRLIIV